MKDRNSAIDIYGPLLTDCLCAGLSYLCALLIRYGMLGETQHRDTYFFIFLWLLIFTISYNTLVVSGRNFLHRGYFIETESVIKQSACQVIFLICILFFLKEAENFSRLLFVYYVLLDGIFLLGSRLLLKKLLRIVCRADKNKTKVMVITDMENVPGILSRLLDYTTYDFEITSVVLWDREQNNGSDSDHGDQESFSDFIEGIPVIADGRNMIKVAKGLPLDEVFIYLPTAERAEIKTMIMDLEIMGVSCHYCIDVIEPGAGGGNIDKFADFTVVTYALSRIDNKRMFLKRLLDIAGGLAGLLITGVLYPFVALAIKLDSKGPAVFSQIRIGKNGRRFRIYKFRSMYMDAEERKKELESKNEMQGLMFKMEDDPRVTKVGKFLRKTSIDEFPQFLNVLKGDMSLVGTRPPTEDEFERYTPYYRRRLCMTPGLTGMWQVSGRSSIDNFDDVVKYDLYYIDHWSLGLDIKILAQTILVVLFGKGAK